MKQKDIKTEIERYLRYSYSKKDVIQRLKNDGFSNDEINKHISVFNAVETNYFNNATNFFPAFVFLLLTIIMSLGKVYSDENFLTKFIFFGITIVLIFITFKFHKNNKSSIIATLSLIVLSILYILYLILDVFMNKPIEISSYLIGLTILLLLLIFVLTSSYKHYKIRNSL